MTPCVFIRSVACKGSSPAARSSKVTACDRSEARFAGDVNRAGALDLDASEKATFQALLNGRIYASNGPQKLLLIRLNEYKLHSEDMSYVGPYSIEVLRPNAYP